MCQTARIEREEFKKLGDICKDRELPAPAPIDKDREEGGFAEKAGHPQNPIQPRQIHCPS